MKAQLTATGCGAAFLALAGTLSLSMAPQTSEASMTQPMLGDEEPPDYIELTGVVRDFRERTATNGHPDFERRPAAGFGHYAGNISAQLGEDGKPVFTGDGRKLTSQYRDAAGRPICHHLYDPALGDTAGTWGVSDSGGITSADSFSQWFHDALGTNMSVSKTLTLRFYRQEDGTYVFDDKEDPLYSQLGGFFPIEGEMYGNPGGSPDRNFHFTFELHTEFTYHQDAAQLFEFVGDDDVWVFINGEMVIDLGGVHGATHQYVDLNRLGLVDGETYTLDFFFAERHRTQSNFRIVTNLLFDSGASTSSISAVYD